MGKKVIIFLYCVAMLLSMSHAWPKQLKKVAPNKLQQQALVTPFVVSANKAAVAPMSMTTKPNRYGLSTHQNKRPYQEDRFDHATINGGDFFGVYDGHGGDKVSSLLKSDLSTYFLKAKGSIESKLQYAFDRVDYISQNSWPNEGSTAVVVYIDTNNVVHYAWTGDSRAVLESDGKVAYATHDHKPDRPDEKKRIENAGGTIFKHGVWRVNGLAVSRSIGDKSCKLEGIGQIIATPEYAQVQLTTDNHFLIIASDGLWDVMSDEESVAMVSKELSQNRSLSDIAQALQNDAIKKGSGDNITVCVIKFDTEIKNVTGPISAIRRWWNWLRGR